MDGKFGKRFEEFRDLCFKLLGMGKLCKMRFCDEWKTRKIIVGKVNVIEGSIIEKVYLV